MAYLKKYRLNAVRQEILEHGTQYFRDRHGLGLHAPGPFSTEYRKLFDETPSMTLQRNEARRQQGL